MVDLDCLVGHSGHARFQQRVGERFAGSQMQICEKNLALAQQRKLCFPRLLDLHNHVGASKNFFCLIDNLCPGFDIFFVRITGADTGILFHQHWMAASGKQIRSRRQQRDALLLLFNFFRDADDHSGK